MWNPPIVKTVATESKGIDDLSSAIQSYLQFTGSGDDSNLVRKQAIARWRLLELLEARLLKDLLSRNGAGAALERMTREIARKEKDPYTAVEELLAEK
jgi:LAO/AO transport system kinase